jgi:hypothetical protein
MAANGKRPFRAAIDTAMKIAALGNVCDNAQCSMLFLFAAMGRSYSPSI